MRAALESRSEVDARGVLDCCYQTGTGGTLEFEFIRRRVTHDARTVLAPGIKSAPGIRQSLSLSILLLAGLAAPPPVTAQASSQQKPPEGAPASAAAQPATATDEDDEAALDLAEPDFVTINLPTTLRLPLHKGNFRLNHRFAGNLRSGTFGELASNLFGIDQGAIIGFEYRVAVVRHVHAAFYRSSFDRTIQLHGKYDAIRQRGSMPVSVSALVSVEGTNNFKRNYAPAVGAVISRELARRTSVYATPVWVNNTAAALDAIAHDRSASSGAEDHDHRSTFYVGLGARVRVRSTVYLVGEVTPRLGGYAPNTVEYGFGIEKRAGAHLFSLTFTNTFGTTFAQLARGGTANSLYLGFNLARKFF